MDSGDLDALLVLNMAEGIGPVLLRRCLEAFGSPQAALRASVRELSAVEGIGPRRASDLRAGIDKLLGEPLLREKELMQQHGTVAVGQDDALYPALLRHIHDPPPILYVRGQLQEEDAVALAIVGSRRCTHYGREQADRLASLGSSAGLCIVSGGAYGVDAAAHRATIRAGGRTIAVLGSGIAKPYPQDHAELFDQIAAGHGAVVSELPMTFPVIAENFPRRNRIISGMSLGVLVVEAAARSGALITARLAAEEHGREVMAVPGRVDSPASAGCHKMIREGWATLVTSLADVLDALGETGQMLKAGRMATPPSEEASASLFDHNVSESQRCILDALGEPRGLDELAAETGLAIAALQADLTMLQIRGSVVKQGATFRRKR